MIKSLIITGDDKTLARLYQEYYTYQGMDCEYRNGRLIVHPRRNGKNLGR